MTLPNFLIIGAPRCATTSLYHYLGSHPEIFMSPIKEPRYFIYADIPTDIQAITSLEDYKKLFSGVENERMIGEATPTYIGRPNVPQKIKALIPDCKMIVTLRNPVERTISHYKLRVNEGKENRSLDEVIAHETQFLPIINAPLDTYAITFSFYHAHLSRFLEVFPREQLHIELLDDFTRDTQSVLKRIYEFLGVSTDYLPEATNIYNKHQGSRSKTVSRVISEDSPLKRFLQNALPTPLKIMIRNTIHRLNAKNVEIVIHEETLKELHKLFREDTLKLQDLLGRDLSHWLE